MNSPAALKFVGMLDEPKNTLGRTEEVVEMVLEKPELIEYLYQCYFQPDEWVRLRVSSSFKRLWRADEELVKPYIAGFVSKVSKTDQPSINWTFAQMCEELDHLLTAPQRATATKRMRGYLETSDDWIVQNCCIATLSKWATADESLAKWLAPKLEGLARSERKSVAKRAAKAIELLAK